MSQQHQPRVVPQPTIVMVGFRVEGGRHVPYPLVTPEGDETSSDLPTVEVDAGIVEAWYQFSDGRN